MTKKVLITGSSGRIGRALHWKLCQKYDVSGLDRSPSSATSIIGDICNYHKLLESFKNAEIVFHAAALHAPHVDHYSEKKFHEINVHATENVCKAALASGVSQIVFTSTTALYGYANQGKEKAVWINEQTIPKPRTIYHKTKLEAEQLLRGYAGDNLKISIIRMSRCFPEPVQQMAVYRLHRGVDYRDVADAHILASEAQNTKEFEVFVISGSTPFLKSDLEELARNPEAVIRQRHSQLANEFDKRNWPFPESIDRVYDPSYAEKKLSWKSKRGPLDVLKQFDNEDYEILPRN
ncbi:MAG: NAD(P)-dependent oxidoreductase [Bacteroidota bacterium]